MFLCLTETQGHVKQIKCRNKRPQRLPGQRAYSSTHTQYLHETYKGSVLNYLYYPFIMESVCVLLLEQCRNAEIMYEVSITVYSPDLCQKSTNDIPLIIVSGTTEHQMKQRCSMSCDQIQQSCYFYSTTAKKFGISYLIHVQFE